MLAQTQNNAYFISGKFAVFLQIKTYGKLPVLPA